MTPKHPMSPSNTDGPVERAVAALAAGRAVVVADAADRENEGDLIAAAEHTTTELMAFFLRHGSGIVCTPMSDARANRLGLAPMVVHNTDNHSTAFTVSVDHVDTGTGISAADRARTVRSLCEPGLQPDELRRPGHVFPLRARPGGVAERPGHTEAAVELTRLAGCSEVAVITELMDDAGTPLSGSRLTEFATMHDLPFVTIEQLAEYLVTVPAGAPAGAPGLVGAAQPGGVRRTGIAEIPTRHGSFQAIAYQSETGEHEHLALVRGDLEQLHDLPEGVLTRIHSECLTGDVVGSLRCDCGAQLDAAIAALAAEPAGVLIYLRGQEGRGIGLGPKLCAYALQEAGLDTVDANRALGLPVDCRDYGVAAAILHHLGIRRVRLITNNGAKSAALSRHGVEVSSTVHHPPHVTADNVSYLQTKRDRMGHLLPATLPVPAEPDPIRLTPSNPSTSDDKPLINTVRKVAP
ncbi:3,4-dihydroxy-2-butanone-4-phosphate synthase [Mycolicibacterium thermoresistibile]|nr:3,4-dihydroxy-2-butanone-4-phosphate synthase [Mycolicibacterium thermoresistibile]GAT13903.1 3,4-dihydroxy-2-butanone 4-phosphate synthase/GTP cyclohydrolase II [Mycolicibacterium thermoresistibile]